MFLTTSPVQQQQLLARDKDGGRNICDFTGPRFTDSRAQRGGGRTSGPTLVKKKKKKKK